METAFTKLITQIYNNLHNFKYDDRLEHFNFFGSEKIRQKALEQMQDDGSSLDNSTSRSKRDKRKGLMRSMDGQLQKN